MLVSETSEQHHVQPGQLLQTWQAFIWTASSRYAAKLSDYYDAKSVYGRKYVRRAMPMRQDSSGFHMYVTAFTAASTVVGKDGTQVYPSVKDANGNFFTADVNGNVIDTLNRTLVTKSVIGSTTFYRCA